MMMMSTLISTNAEDKWIGGLYDYRTHPWIMIIISEYQRSFITPPLVLLIPNTTLASYSIMHCLTLLLFRRDLVTCRSRCIVFYVVSLAPLFQWIALVSRLPTATASRYFVDYFSVSLQTHHIIWYIDIYQNWSLSIDQSIICWCLFGRFHAVFLYFFPSESREAALQKYVMVTALNPRIYN